ncbi:MAG: DMT family transporter [Silicimonas sp.]|nr:DMT family transporter [Silicimonas sp.]
MIGPPNNRRGVALMALGFFCFSVSDTLTKLLATEGVHPLQIVWARQTGLVLVVLLLAIRIGPAILRTQQPGLQILRGALAVLAPLCFAVAFAFVPLAEGIAVTFIAPLIVIALSALFLGENVTRWQWLATMIGLVGAIVIVRPGAGLFHPTIVLAFCAATLFATRQVIGRVLARRDNAETTMAFTALVGFSALSIALPFVWVAPSSPRVALIFAGMALSAAFGEICTIRAVEMASAAIVAPMQYTTILWATLFGWMIFAQLPDVWTWVGTAIIVASGIYIIRSATSAKPLAKVSAVR